MFGLKDNIYKILAIMSINDTFNPHDMQIIGLYIVRNYILLFKPYEEMLFWWDHPLALPCTFRVKLKSKFFSLFT
jgi:hypothetical protein